MYIETCTNDKGQIRPDHADLIKDWLAARPRKSIFIEMIEKKPRRTISMNSKFHAMIRMGTELLKEDMKEKGNPDYAKITEKVVKGIIRKLYLTVEETINGKEFEYERSTADLNVEEFSDLINSTYMFFAERGIELP